MGQQERTVAPGFRERRVKRPDLPYNEGSLASVLAGGVVLDLKLLLTA